MVKFDGKVFEIDFVDTRLVFDIYGNIEFESPSEESEKFTVFGLGKKALEFVDALLKRGDYEIIKVEVQGPDRPRLDLEIGEYKLITLADGHLDLTLRRDTENLSILFWKPAILLGYTKFRDGKKIYTKIFSGSDYVLEDGINLLMRHKLSIRFERTFGRIEGDRLYILSGPYGDVVMKFEPETWEFGFVACGGVTRRAEVFYEWLLNVVKRHSDEFEIQRKGSRYKFKYAGFTIGYDEAKPFADIAVKYQADDLVLTLRNGKLKMQSEGKVYVEGEGDDYEISQIVKKILEILIGKQ